MSTNTTNLLRRTFAGLGAALALAANQALAQGTVTLSGTSGNSCSYSQMTVTPNGNITVNCGTSEPGGAVFALSHSSATSNYVLPPNTSSSATVSRTGGPAEALVIAYAVTSTNGGCTPSSGGISLLLGQSQTIPFSVGTAGTSCTVSIGIPTGGSGVASPNTITFTAQTTQPPPPPPGGVDGCPAIPSTSVAGTTAVNDFQTVDQLKMTSGQIAYYVVPSSPSAAVVVEFSQTQMANTPPGAVTDFQVSKCPGVFDPPGVTIASQCRYTGYNVNINNLKIWTSGTAQYPTQDTLPPGNCMAPAGSYINIRWNYPSCPFPSFGCGFSNRWIQHTSNSPF
jgi:hypothetical protein